MGDGGVRARSEVGGGVEAIVVTAFEVMRWRERRGDGRGGSMRCEMLRCKGADGRVR
jgi:hypothetical protein